MSKTALSFETYGHQMVSISRIQYEMQTKSCMPFTPIVATSHALYSPEITGGRMLCTIPCYFSSTITTTTTPALSVAVELIEAAPAG